MIEVGPAARPTWDEWALGIAAAVAQRGDCIRSQVGAIALDEHHIVVGHGYNGAPSGAPGCLSDGACPRAYSDVEPLSSYDTGPGACIALHAEQNLVLHANWRDLRGATIYITREPCGGCWRLIRGAAFSRVVWPEGEEVL